MSPDTGVAVGLQLERHRRTGGAGPRVLRARALVAQQVLHVVAELVSDHVCLGKIARGPEPLRQLIEESEVEIDQRSAGQ